MSWGTFTGFRLVIGILAIIAIVLEVITWITAFQALRKSKETNSGPGFYCCRHHNDFLYFDTQKGGAP